MPTLVDLFRREGSKVDRVAVVSDVRGGEYFGRLEQLLDELHERGVEYTLVFLEASNEALVRRFKETRRRHPLAAGGSVIDGIRKERRLLAGLRERAHLVVDTSDISIHQLKARLNEDLIQHTRRTNIVFAVVSFGYKYGIPIDADLLFDVRFLPNPHYDLRLRPLTGLDAEVRDFVLRVAGHRRSTSSGCSRCSTSSSRATRPRARRTSPSASAAPAGGTARSPSRSSSASATRSRATTRSCATGT